MDLVSYLVYLFPVVLFVVSVFLIVRGLCLYDPLQEDFRYSFPVLNRRGSQSERGFGMLVAGILLFCLVIVPCIGGLLHLTGSPFFIFWISVSSGIVFALYYLCTPRGLLTRKVLKKSPASYSQLRRYSKAVNSIISESQNPSYKNCRRSLMTLYYRASIRDLDGFIRTLSTSSNTANSRDVSARWVVFRLSRNLLDGICKYTLFGNTLGSEGEQYLFVCTSLLNWFKERGQISDSEYSSAYNDLNSSCETFFDDLYPT